MIRPILELHNISKTFGSKIANDDVSLSFHLGAVHAIVGENGAGKTTLMNIISGNLQPDSGTMVFDGAPVTVSDPNRATALGIGMVHQHFKLVPSLTVSANIFLGRELSNRFGMLDQRAMEQRVVDLSGRFGLKVNPRDRVRDLSVGERQRVEIIKALSHDTRLLILDEPTAVLTPVETEELFVVVRQLAAQGWAVVFISHKLNEVLSIADEVTVIRDGGVVDTRPARRLGQTDIASMMVGRKVLLRVQHTAGVPGEEVLKVDDLCATDARGAIAVNGLSLRVRRGEIVGIAGVEGNGQTELAAAIAGTHIPPRGRIVMTGIDVTSASVSDRRRRGLAYIPEDRYDEGSGPKLSVAENIAATHLSRPLVRFGWVSIAAMRTFAYAMIKKFDVRGAKPETAIGTLSGGNMQKVIIAREFESNPSFLLIAQPTRGVDVGATEYVHNALVGARDDGAGVLLISADLNEVLSLSDRLLVIFRGRIVAEFTREEATELTVGLAMAGITPTADALAVAEAERDRRADELEATGTTLIGTADDNERRESKISPDVEKTAPKAAELVPLVNHRMHTARPHRATGLCAEFVINTYRSATQPILAVLAALVLGAVIILAMGQNPITAYVALFVSGWTTTYGVSTIVALFIPLAIMAIGTIISFRAGFFNIGGEGQMYFGAFFGAWAGFTFHGLPPVILMVIILTVGATVGALWGLLPGALFAAWRVNIVVTTLLLSQVAILITNYFVTGPFQDRTAGAAASHKIDPDAVLTMFFPALGIGPDLVIAILVTVLVGLMLTRTTWGLKVKELGEMNRFAEYAGVSTRTMSMQVMMVSGAAAGFAGALYVIGPNGGRFLQAFSPGFGFLAITVALLARLNPWASMVAALLYATMMEGTTGLQTVGVPFPLVSVLQGLIIIAVTATFVLNLRKRAWSPRATRLKSTLGVTQ